jgi:hypothetical protein
MALDPEQYLRTVQREYLDFIDDDVSANKSFKFFLICCCITTLALLNIIVVYMGLHTLL